MTDKRILGNTPLTIGGKRHPHTNEITQPYKEPIDDAESFIRHILDRWLKDNNMYIQRHEYEDAVMELIQILLKAERRYNPEINPSFVGYSAYILGKRVVDVVPRALLGRSGGRIAQRSHQELDEHAARSSGYGTALAAVPSDVDTGGGGDAGRLQRDRDRRRAGANAIMGKRAA